MPSERPHLTPDMDRDAMFVLWRLNGSDELPADELDRYLWVVAALHDWEMAHA